VRLLRLVRLLTFIKAVPTLRGIAGGLLVGLRSVTYIVILLFLIIYIFAIVCCMFFGRNDPARFGGVAISMLSLYQVPSFTF
jgi:voltage-gated sodium channel